MFGKLRKQKRFFLGVFSILSLILIVKYATTPSNPLFDYNTPRIPGEDLKGNTNQCKPKKNIVFVKTHKTGSSTVTNILHRHGDRHGHVFGLPRFGENRLDWPFRVTNDSFELPTGRQVNIICHHGRYNRSFYQHLMPNDTVYVTILRHPVAQYESTFNYMGFPRILGIDEQVDPLKYFLENPREVLTNYVLLEDLRKDSIRLKLVRNGMAFDLGLDAPSFDNPTKIAEFQRSLRNDFDLVMITEYFEESIILLKRLLCWSLEDFAYFKLNVRHKKDIKITNISGKTINLMKKWNNVDFKIYQQFHRIFLNKISQLEIPDFHGELQALSRQNTRLHKLCLKKHGSLKLVEDGVRVNQMKLSNEIGGEVRETCGRMRRNEVDYITYLRAKQSSLLKTLLFHKTRGLLKHWLRIFINKYLS